MTETDRAMVAIAEYDAEMLIVGDGSISRSDARHEMRVLRGEIERSAIAIATAVEIMRQRRNRLASLTLAVEIGNTPV
jgi:hypothetical protein